MFTDGQKGRSEYAAAQFSNDSQPRTPSAQPSGHVPLHQRRGQSADLWKGLLWQPKHVPITSISAAAMRQSHGYFTPPQDWDDLSLKDEAEIILPASTRLRHMISHSDRIIVASGVYDGLSARIALSVGFDAMYMV